VSYRCCLCDAAGESRPGRICDGEGVPLCPRCRAEIRWKRRESPAALPISHQLAFERVMVQSATGARSDAPEAA
jgi:hypothetical protein